MLGYAQRVTHHRRAQGGSEDREGLDCGDVKIDLATACQYLLQPVLALDVAMKGNGDEKPRR